MPLSLYLFVPHHSTKKEFSLFAIHFIGVSEEYTKKKEEQLEQKKHRRLTAKQAQRHKDNELWEKNRMFRSGAVTRTDYDEDFEEISEAKVHLIVNNIIPPFLDGRIVFTKQQEPVVPIRDATSNMVYFLLPYFRDDARC